MINILTINIKKSRCIEPNVLFMNACKESIIYAVYIGGVSEAGCVNPPPCG